jgi:hypothetical protein
VERGEIVIALVLEKILVCALVLPLLLELKTIYVFLEKLSVRAQIMTPSFEVFLCFGFDSHSSPFVLTILHLNESKM